MRNLVLLLIRFKDFLVFGCFILLSSYLVVNHNHLQRVHWLSASNGITGAVNTKTKNISNYFGLLEVNEELSRQHAHLLTQMAMLQSEKDQLRDSLYRTSIGFKTDSTYVKDSLGKVQLLVIKIPDGIHDFIPAQIIKNSTISNKNFLTINKGFEDSVAVNDGVVTPDGIVGRVVYASENYALVKSVLHVNNNISVKLSRQRELGTLIWKGKKGNICSLLYIPRHTKVLVGDSVCTSGYSGVYPTDYLLGTITKAVLNKNQTFYDLEVTLNNNINGLDHVLIYKNKNAQEIEAINQKIEELH